MIDWRRLTVITFHSTATNVLIANMMATAGTLETSPITADVTAPPTSVTHSDGPEPSRLAIHDAVHPPTMPPTAPAIVSTANSVVDVPRTSCANSTKAANAT